MVYNQRSTALAFLTLYLQVGLVILGMMTGLWLLSLALKDASIVRETGSRTSAWKMAKPGALA